MKNLTISKLFLEVFFVFTFTFICYSLEAGVIDRTKVFYRTNNIVSGATLAINDAAYGTFDVETYQYIVQLSYNRNLLSDKQNDDWTFEVEFSIQSNGSTLHTNQIVSIEKKPITEDKLIDVVLFNNINAPNAKIQITNVSGGVFPNDIQLEFTQRKNIKENTHLDKIQNTNIGNVLINGGEKLRIFWQYFPGAEKYELEWVYIDAQDINSGLVNVNNVFDHFKLNTTETKNRHYKEPVNVIVNETYYDIPLTYSAGKIYYRVRPLGLFNNTAAINYTKGKWNTPAKVLDFIGFENTKNWQAITSFAEEGKSKNIVKYIDGSYRTRQTLTDLSTNNNTLVAETMYDYEGRNSLNILPTVLNQSKLSYIANLNIENQTGQVYDKKHFDKIGVAPILKNTSGSAQYYSANNNVNQINQDQIPNAFNFPITQTKFVRDGTNRPMTQSGVGTETQILSGKETKYFYGGTNSTELRRLFGKNVGLSKYYRKNMVRDPNGQLSVSYIDNQERTIATALIGQKPDNLLALPNDAPVIITNLNENNTFDIESKTWTSVSKILNAVNETQYTFTYDFTGAINTLGAPFNVCSTCEYEVEIMVKDPDGELLPIFTSPVCPDQGLAPNSNTSFNPLFNSNNYILKESFPKNAFDCSTTAYPNNTIQFEMKFCKIGDYEIIKRLKINDHTLEAAFNALIGTIDTHTLHQTIIENELNQIDSTQCEYTCAQTYWGACKAIYKLNNNLTENQWNALSDEDKNNALATCIEDSCSAEIAWVVEEIQADECANLLQQMKKQMKRDGIANTGNNSHDGVYNDGIRRTEENNVWNSVRNALQNLVGTKQTNFINDVANCYSDLVFYDNNGNIINYNSNIQVICQRMRTDANYCEWIEDWIVMGHPEYCHYVLCIKNMKSETFDSKLQITKTYTDAISLQNNYLNYRFAVPVFFSSNTASGFSPTVAMPNNYPSYFSTNSPISFPTNSLYSGQDPYFSGNGLGVNYLTDLRNEMQNFSGSVYDNHNSGYDIWHYFHPQSIHPNGSSGATITGKDKFYTSVNMADLDEVLMTHWRLFRSAYLGLKAEIQEKYKKDNCAYLNKPYAIVSPQNLPSTEQEIDQFIAEQEQQYTSNLCNSKINGWRQQLLSINANNLSITCFNNNVAPHLLAYCNQSAGLANPDGLLFTADLLNAAPGSPLYLAQQALTNCCSSCYLDSIATPNPYTLITNANGTNYQHTTTSQDPCLQEALNAAMLYVYPSFSNPMANYKLYLLPNSQCMSYIEVQSNAQRVNNNIALTNQPIETPCYESEYMFNNYFNNLLTIKLQLQNEKNACWFNAVWLNAEQNANFGVIRGISNITIDMTQTSNTGRLKALKIKATAHLLNGETTNVWLYEIKTNCPSCETIEASFTQSTNVIGGISDTYTNPSYIAIDFDELTQNCQEQSTYEATQRATNIFKDSITSLLNQHLEGIINNCFNFNEQFYAQYNLMEYHYTLYYYDQAGNLTQTIPPEGVHPLPENHFPTSNQGKWDGTDPTHTMQTKYTYNSLNQLIHQSTPDGGRSHFFYDKKGQLKLSVNEQQLIDEKASYTLYDNLGRIVEVGELNRDIVPLSMTDAHVKQWRKGLSKLVFKDYTTDQDFINAIASGTNYNTQQKTITVYGDATANANNIHPWQKNTRGRVAYVLNTNTANQLTSTTRYSYDPHGNVNKLKQNIAGWKEKTIDYSYDLLSGNVNRVSYQKGKIDQLLHQYEYDADNRITNVYISKNHYLWNEEAEYFYYAHGPLARVELGEDKIQGLDYYYTLHGWLKGINAAHTSTADPGKDAQTNSLNQNIVKDAFALNLGYHQNDYNAISSNWALTENWTNIHTQLEGNKGLYNGNIVYQANNIAPDLKDATTQQHPFAGSSFKLSAYKYDQLNRIIESTNAIGSTNFGISYGTFYQYDANGNIKFLQRSNFSGENFDLLSYNYNYQAANNPNSYLKNNKLRSVNEYAPSPQDGAYNDIKAGQAIDNYTYDKIGNLISDASEEISNIKWTVYGKVAAVLRTPSSTKPNIYYKYDAMGNRISKKVVQAGSNTSNTTYYVRDASGNIMANYTIDQATPQQYEIEYPLYGSSRLGVLKEQININTTSPTVSSVQRYKRIVGKRQYELSNHLGNVQVVVSDKRKGIDTDNNGRVNYYLADVQSAQDYTPFGMQMPARSFTGASGYKFGFNGMLKDGKDWTGNDDSHLDFGARIYDSRLGRWLAVDPLAIKYPYMSSYNFALNTPIQAKDPDGRLVLFVNGQRPGGAQGRNSRGGRQRLYGFKGDGTSKQKGSIDHFADFNMGVKRDLKKYWGSFAGKYQNKVQDNNRVFVDGSRLFTSGADKGMAIGREQGKLLVQKIESGEIAYKQDETIKIAAHSQGAAVGAGMADYLIEKGYNVETYDAYAAQDAGDIVLPEGIGKSTEYFRNNDEIVRDGGFTGQSTIFGTSNIDAIQGVDKRVELQDRDESNGGHGISTYEEDLFDGNGNETQQVDKVTVSPK